MITYIYLIRNRYLPLFISIFFISFHVSLKAQIAPPRPISVVSIQGLSFGAFYQSNSGGTVIIYPDGTRSVTGDIVQLSMGQSYFPASFEIDANPGTLISILGGSTTLYGSNGGSMYLQVGASSPVSPFVTTAVYPARTSVTIGGTLTIGSPVENLPGSYSGTVQVTFMYE